MFTGIVERTATVRHVVAQDAGRRFVLRVEETPGLPPWKSVDIGESIAVDGVCLTAVEVESRSGGGDVAFDVVPETLSKTAFGDLRPGAPVNIERSLAVGDSFGGHYVTGHVDGVGTVQARRPEGGQILFEIAAPGHLIALILSKGSIAVDGISLTVIDVDRAAGWFSFAAIPHTLERTNLHLRQRGSKVNLETDAFGKWVVHSLESIVGTGSKDQRLRRLLEASGWFTSGTGENNNME